MKPVTIIGGGLAGCEAAFFLAERGVKVTLYDIKPHEFTEAHKSINLCELLCSNSLRSDSLSNASGLLKAEMRMLGSLIMKIADETKVPAGSALAVDRDAFSGKVNQLIQNHPNITFVSKEVKEINLMDTDSYTILSPGPLVTKPLEHFIKNLTSSEHCFFFDAIAPVVDASTIDMNIAFKASRYDKGGDDYINCPMDKEQYLTFYSALISGEQAELKDFEQNRKLFEGCMPVEEIAKRGIDSLCFGPLKPVGLPHPETGRQFHAVVQLRTENIDATFFNLVGFQTHLKIKEQRRIFHLIPGLENAKFERYGHMHRNTYINSPEIIEPSFRMKKYHHIYFAGQITGVEGYLESAASGLIAAHSIYTEQTTGNLDLFPVNTAMRGLSTHISTSKGQFQPSNIIFALLPPCDKRIRGRKQKREYVSHRAMDALLFFIKQKQYFN